MSNPPDPLDEIPTDPFDEILWIDEARAVEKGIYRSKWSVTFGDGTRLIITASVKEPPAQEQTPITARKSGREWLVFDPITGKGATDARELAHQSTAYRMAVKMVELVKSEVPERPKIVCPLCDGSQLCVFCEGNGCEKCKDTGHCPQCKGRGEVLED